jgi:hypothetical protein
MLWSLRSSNRVALTPTPANADNAAALACTLKKVKKMISKATFHDLSQSI